MDNIKAGVWIEPFTVQGSDIDCGSRAKLSFILEIMQRTADLAVHSLGLSVERMLEAGMGWMLITLDLEFHRYPLLHDQLTVHTWSKGTKGVLWLRDYRIVDKDGHLIAAARSTWALVDIGKRKLLRPSALPIEVVHYDGDSVGEIPEKVTVPGELALEEAYHYQVRYSGLDSNNHLNNARYGDICCDILSPEDWDTRMLKQFRITYMQEAKFGDEFVVQRSVLTDEKIYIQGQMEGNVLFAACLIF